MVVFRPLLLLSTLSALVPSISGNKVTSSFTLTRDAVFRYEVKKSLFVARARCCGSGQEAMSFLESVRDTSAGHNCWAYVINLAQVRCSDDGEPSGTAGKPSKSTSCHFIVLAYRAVL
jgi:hypothetical protein